MPKTVFCYDDYFLRYGKLNIFLGLPPRNLLNYTVLLKSVSFLFFQLYSRKANNQGRKIESLMLAKIAWF